MYYGYTSFYDIDVDDGLCDDVRDGMGVYLNVYDWDYWVELVIFLQVVS